MVIFHCYVSSPEGIIIFSLRMLLEGMDSALPSVGLRPDSSYQILGTLLCQFRLVLIVNGHDSGTDLLEVPTIYKAYVRPM